MEGGRKWSREEEEEGERRVLPVERREGLGHCLLLATGREKVTVI